MSKLIAALDTSSPLASFVVAAEGGEALISHVSPCTGRDSSALLPDLLAALGEIALADIDHWTVGMGPGSFTGVRVGAALVRGICAGTDARLRGIPSSLALAAATEPAEEEMITTLYDGRKHEVVRTRYQRRQGALRIVGAAHICAIAELDAGDGRHAILADDPSLAAVAAGLGDRLVRVPKLDAAHLLVPPWQDGEDPDRLEPVYARPAVFVPPAAAGPPAAVREWLQQHTVK